MWWQLFIIFGKKARDKDHGPAYPVICANCENHTYLHAYGWRTWAHVFYIPIIPLGHTGTLACPICATVHELEDHAWMKAKELATVTQDYHANRADQRKYYETLRDFQQSTEFVDEPIDPDEIVSPEQAEPESSPAFH